MTKSPYLNALFAGLYSIGIVFLISALAKPNTPDNETLLVPMMMLSLFVLSAAVMGFLFVGEPLMLYLDGKREEAVKFFLTTVATFAVITVCIFAAVFYVV